MRLTLMIMMVTLIFGCAENNSKKAKLYFVLDESLGGQLRSSQFQSKTIRSFASSLTSLSEADSLTIKVVYTNRSDLQPITINFYKPLTNSEYSLEVEKDTDFNIYFSALRKIDTDNEEAYVGIKTVTSRELVGDTYYVDLEIQTAIQATSNTVTVPSTGNVSINFIPYVNLYYTTSICSLSGCTSTTQYSFGEFTSLMLSKSNSISIEPTKFTTTQTKVQFQFAHRELGNLGKKTITVYKGSPILSNTTQSNINCNLSDEFELSQTLNHCWLTNIPPNSNKISEYFKLGTKGTLNLSFPPNTLLKSDFDQLSIITTPMIYKQLKGDFDVVINFSNLESLKQSISLIVSDALSNHHILTSLFSYSSRELEAGLTIKSNSEQKPSYYGGIETRFPVTEKSISLRVIRMGNKFLSYYGYVIKDHNYYAWFPIYNKDSELLLEMGSRLDVGITFDGLNEDSFNELENISIDSFMILKGTLSNEP